MTELILTGRELDLVRGMIEVQTSHIQQCDRIQNQEMAIKQRKWDNERIVILHKVLESQQGG